ncbi:hypothetical protein TCAL_11591 [Tigriopus californicus]|uniref:Carbonic anhydrase n=1 Tax=Tigriopus californicus TaxID=6832 RepID=A0A553NF12_TIGCA|nr:hypothetical protein TCAL_11591 [Tigriopus californicus]
MWLLVLGICFIASHIMAVPSWDYEDTSNWCTSFPDCCPEKVRQSPIDIMLSKATKKSLGPIMHSMATLSPITGTVKNNGHTLQFDLPEEEIEKLDRLITGGPLGSDSYQLAQFHFHWGRTQRTGSEHALDGQFFPAEVHFVHFNTKYDDLMMAASEEDGISVIGMFIEVEEAVSEAFMPIVEKTRDIRVPESEASEVTIDLAKIYSQVADPQKYTSYLGSLTTPGCNEVVTWINLLDPIKIGRVDDFPICCPESQRQSPINIRESRAIMTSFPSLVTSTSATSPLSGVVKNNGHTIQFDVDLNQPKFTISGGPLDSDTYEFIQFHLHWGSINKVGSEHSFDGKFFPAEIHLVHVNTKYATTSQALAAADGLAVIGIFMERGRGRNIALRPMMDVLNDLEMPDSSVSGVQIDLNQIYANVADKDRFTTYLGSLTTPGCNEAVTWINLLDPIPIGRTDLLALRSRLNNDMIPMQDNFRPIQCNAQTLRMNQI